jgi:O-antigen/teichoic acid export membrane protein
MKTMKRVVLKNASANLARMMMAGIVSLFLPPFLARTLSTATYSTWVLLLQLTGYVGFLEFGLQTAISRFVAHAEELDDVKQRDGIVSTAFVLLTLASFLGLCLIAAVAWKLPQLFPAMPGSLHSESRIALLVMGATFAFGLPSSALQSIFLGRQRNEIPVLILVSTKAIMAVLLVVAVRSHSGIVAMSSAVAVSNIFATVASYGAWRLLASDVIIRFNLVDRQYARQIIDYCMGLGVLSFAMLLISGLDLVIVGIFDYGKTAYYSAAATLTSVLTLTQNSIFSALLPASAVLSARQDSDRLGAILVESTRYGMLFLLFIAIPFLLVGKTIFELWMGRDFAVHSTLIMQLLVVANIVRLSLLPYTTLVLGVGLQRQTLLSPIAESITNLIASIAGAILWGAPGVAIGTLLGSVVGVTIHLLYHMPRTKAITINRLQLVREGLGRPLACALPCFALIGLRELSPNMSVASLSLVGGISILGAVYLLWNVGLKTPERQLLERVLWT